MKLSSIEDIEVEGRKWTSILKRTGEENIQSTWRMESQKGSVRRVLKNNKNIMFIIILQE